MNRAERIAKQLGMSQGAANNKLRKAVLFSYVKRVGDNFCYKCGAEIENPDEFSLEHKYPWEGRNSDLFWDLNNISFSHPQCNRPHVHKGPKGRPSPHRKCSDGLFWCWRCQTCQEETKFNKNKTNSTGVEYVCKVCRSAYRYGLMV